MVNDACSAASHLKIMGSSMAAFAVLRVLPIVGYDVYAFLFFAIPIIAIRWKVKFRSVRSNEPDFVAAKRGPRIAMGWWALSLC
jgi:hypothetical protein